MLWIISAVNFDNGIAFILFLYTAIIVLLVVLEKYYLERHSGKAKIIVAVSLVISLMLFGAQTPEHSYTENAISEIQITDDAFLYVTLDKNRNITHLGQVATGEDEDMTFYNISMKDGRIYHIPHTISEKDFEFAFNMTNIYYKKFAGESETYSTLEKYRKEKTEYLSWSECPSSSVTAAAVRASLPFIICTFIYLFTFFRKKRRNMMKKMKLKDL